MNRLIKAGLSVFLGLAIQGRCEAVEKSAQNRIRVACVGDSITQGVGITNPAENSYPAQLSGLLGESWDVRNFGLSGTTLLRKGDSPYIAAPHYKLALAFHPDVVVIKLGTNDTKPFNWRYNAEFISDYVQLINDFREVNSNVVIWICYPVPVYQDYWGIIGETVAGRVIPFIAQVAEQTGVNVINLYSALSNKPEMFPDGVHPNVAGAGVIAETIAGKVCQY